MVGSVKGYRTTGVNVRDVARLSASNAGHFGPGGGA